MENWELKFFLMIEFRGYFYLSDEYFYVFFVGKNILKGLVKNCVIKVLCMSGLRGIL